MTAPTRSERRAAQPPKTIRATLPKPQPLRLPTGYYDPDSAAFDETPALDLDELFRSTTPAQPVGALRPVGS